MITNGFEFSEQLVIQPSDDCVRGHFPNQAIVPGAYLISQIDLVLQQKYPELSLRSLKKVKFAAPLTPGTLVTLICSSSDGRNLKFKLQSNDHLIVQGSGVVD